MPRFDANEYFNRVAAESVDLAPTAWDTAINKMDIKKKELEEATQRKLAALQANDKHQEFKKQWGHGVANLGTGSDTVGEFMEGGVKSVGGTIGGAGNFLEIGGELTGRALDTIGIGDIIRDADNYLRDEFGIGAPSEGLQATQEWLGEGAKIINEGQDLNFRKAMKDSTPQGDVFDPSSWTPGSNPSIAGYAGHAANVLGGFIPQLATLGTGNATAAAARMATMGGLSVGGEKAEEAENYVMAQSEPELFNSSELYRALRESSPEVTHEAAQAEVAKAAGQSAFMGSAPVGAVGGAATAGILGPLQRRLQGNLLTRVGSSAVLGTTEEAAQEVGETVAARAATNVGIGGNQDLTADTLADAVLGGGLGGSMATAGALVEEGQRNKQAKLDKKQAKRLEHKQDERLAQSLVENNEVGKLLDPEVIKNSSLEAIGKTLIALAQGPDKEISNDYKTRALGLLDELDQRIENERTNLKLTNKEMTAAKIKEKQKIYNGWEKIRNKAEKDGDEATVAEATENMKIAQDLIAEIQADTPQSKKERSLLLRRYRNMQKKVASIQSDAIRATTDMPAINLIKEQALSAADDTEFKPEERITAAREAVTLAMDNPDILDIEEARTLAEDTTLNLDDDQRDYLRKLVSRKESEARLNDFNNVNLEVFEGNEEYGFRGLKEYRALVGAAAKAGNTKRVSVLMDQLDRFGSSHASKAATIAEARDIAAETGRQTQMIAVTGDDGKLSWEINRGKKLSDEALAENGGLNVNKPNKNGSIGRMADTIASIAAEAEAIAATKAELEAMLGIKTKPSKAQAAQPQAAAAEPAVVTEETESVAKSTPVDAKTPPKPEVKSEPTKEAQETAVPVAKPKAKPQPAPVDASKRSKDARVDKLRSNVAKLRDLAKTITDAGGRDNVEDVDVYFADATEGMVDALESLSENHRSAVVRGAAKGALAEAKASDDAASLARTLTNVGKLATEYDTSTPDLFETADAEDVKKPEKKSALSIDNQENPAKRVSGQLAPDSFYGYNLIKAYFRTELGRVLTTEKDYLSNVLAQEVKRADGFSELLSNDPTVAANQQRVMKRFYEEAKVWNGLMDGLLGSHSERFKHENPLEFYVNPDGTLDENIKTAISAAIFTFIQDNGNDLWGNDDDQMKAILNLPEDAVLSHEQKSVLHDVGMRESAVVADLGQRIVDALGQKLNKDAPTNHAGQLNGAFGAFAVAVMLKAGENNPAKAPIQRVGIQSEIFGQDAINGIYPTQFFIRANKTRGNKNRVVDNAYVNEIVESARGTQGFMYDVFSIEPRVSDVLDAPPKESVKTVKRTDRKVSKELYANIHAAEQQAHYPREDMLGEDGFLTKVGPELLMRMEGFQDIDTETMQVNLIASQEGKNNGAERTVRNLFQFAKDRAADMTKPFYMKRFVASQNRVHLDSRVFNPQEMKLHRIAFKMDGWESEVPRDFSGEVGYRFMYTVAEAMGEKVGNMTRDEVIEKFHEIENKPEVIEALRVIEMIDNKEPLSLEDENDLLNALPKASWSLDALWHLHKRTMAVAKGEDTFTSTLHAEGDGRVNGPTFSLAQLGELNAETGQRGGFYTEAQGFREASDWAAIKTNMDPYEGMGHSVATAVEAIIAAKPNGSTKATRDLLYTVFGNFLDKENYVTEKGRKAFKNPFTKLMFGAGIDGSIDAMANEMIDKIYAATQSLMDKYPSDPQIEQGIGELIDQLNAVLPKSQQIKNAKTYDGARTLTLTPAQIESLTVAFKDDIGVHIENTIVGQYSKALSKRSVLNQSMGLAFTLYKAVYNREKQKMLDELNVARTKTKKEPLQTLTAEQEKELQSRVEAIAPVVHSALSKTNGDTDAGLKMVKRGKAEADGRDPAYSGELKLTAPVRMAPDGVNDGLQVNKRTNANAVKSMQFTDNAGAMEEIEPGVAPLIRWIHSFDSTVISRVYKRHNILNVHDAAIASPEMLVQIIKELNQETVNAMIEASMPEEFMQGLVRSVAGYQEYVNGLEANERTAFTDSVNEQLKAFQSKAEVEEGIKPHLATIVQKFIARAEIMDRQNMQWLRQVKYVSQYGFPGAYYEMTENDYARIDKRLATPFRDRINNRAKANDDGATATLIKKLLIGGEAKLTSLIMDGSPLKNGQDFVKNLRAVNKIYLHTGDLEAALEQGISDVKQRDKMRSTLQKRIANSTPESKSLDHAPAGRIMDMLQSAQRSPYVDKKLKPVLQRVFNELVAQGDTETYGQTLEGHSIDNAIQLGTGKQRQYEQVRELLTRMYNGYYQTPWGTLAPSEKPLTAEQRTILTALQNDEAMTVGKMMPVLEKALETMPVNDRQRLVLASVLSNIKKHTDPNVPIQLVTGDTPISLAPKFQNPYRTRGAWHGGHREGGQEVIYIKGPDFLESNITVELLAHEMLHSLLADTVANEMAAKRANPKHYNPAVSPYVSELIALRSKAAAFIKGKPDLELKYQAAVGSVDELMSWGMTDQGFQEEVLNQFEMESRNKNKPQVKGLKAFIESITSLFTGKRDNNPKLQTGLEILVNNVAAIMESGKAKEAAVHSETLAQQGPDPVADVESYTTEQVYDELQGDERPEIKDLLDTIVGTLHGPAGAIKAAVSKVTAVSPGDAYLQAQATGEMPFGSKSKVAGLAMSDKELFVLEQVEVTLQAAVDTRSLADKELNRLFLSARDTVTAADLPGGQAEYDFIFDIEHTNATSKSDHLTRFAALAMVYKPLSDLLQYNAAPNNDTTSDKLGDRIQSLFNKGLQGLTNSAINARDTTDVQTRLNKLAQKLVQVENRRRVNVATGKIGLIEQVERANQANAGKIRGKVAEIARKPVFRDSEQPTVRIAAKLIQYTAEERMGQYLDEVDLFRVDMFGAREGFVASMVNEVRGVADDAKPLLNLLNAYASQQRTKMGFVKNTRKHVMDAFGEAGKTMSKDTRKALTRVLIKADLSALMTNYDMAKITTLVTDKAALLREIKRKEKQLKTATDTDANYNFYVNQAQALGEHLASGEIRSPWLQFNATAIAKQHGMKSKISDAQVTAVTPIIDELTSMYALMAMDDGLRIMAGNVMTEQQRRNSNGVEFMLKVHKDLKKDALEKNFSNDPTLMMKGYTKEIYDPKVEVEAAKGPRAIELAAMGYVPGEQLEKDSSDPDQDPEYLYILKDGGMVPWVTGSVAYAGMRAKGNRIHGGRYSISMDETLRINDRENKRILAEKQPLINALYRPDAIHRFKGKRFMAPIINTRGEATNWRYLMKEDDKDSILNRDNTFDNVLGSMAGSIYEKMSGEQQNRNVMQALKDQYDGDTADNRPRYIEFGPDARDADIREMYHLLPDATKIAIRDIWGSNQVMVRSDTLNMVFGYRQYSLAEAVNKDAQARNIAEAVLVHLVEGIWGTAAAKKVQKYEDIMQGIVKEIKDFYVVKNLWTLVGNQLSNISILLWYGVSPKDVLKGQKEAIDGLLRYSKDSDELMRLERLKRTDSYTGPAKELDQKIKQLEHAIARNPVKHLIDAGQFQTIIEDLDAEDDQFSYKSRLTEWAEDKTGGLPEGLKTAGKFAYISHDTTLYKLLHKSTQMSDFLARYTLYNHLVNEPEATRMSEEEIQHRIKETFINYDVPTHKGLDYMNKTGLVMFSKYYLRIQRVLMTMYSEKPVRGILMLLFSHFFDNIETVQDSSVFGRLGNNPFDTGPLGLPGAITESIVLQGALSPLN